MNGKPTNDPTAVTASPSSRFLVCIVDRNNPKQMKIDICTFYSSRTNNRLDIL